VVDLTDASPHVRRLETPTVPRGTLWRTPRPSAPFERPPFAEATWEATGGVLGGGPFRRGYLGTYSGLCRTPLPAPGFAPSPAPGGRVGGYYALTLGRAFASPGRATLRGPTPGPEISVARLGGWVVKGAPPTAAVGGGTRPARGLLGNCGPFARPSASARTRGWPKPATVGVRAGASPLPGRGPPPSRGGCTLRQPFAAPPCSGPRGAGRPATGLPHGWASPVSSPVCPTSR